MSMPKLQFAKRQFSNNAYKKIRALWNGALRAYIEAATEHARVDTGMSVASWRPLAARVRGSAIVDSAVANANPPRNGKSIPKGIAQGKSAYEYEIGSPDDINFYFRFKITVYQYVLHETGTYDTRPPGGWRTLNAGRRAMNDYLQANINKVPLYVKPYIKTRGRVTYAR